MSYTLLHDSNNADSNTFKALFGSSGDIIEGNDSCVTFYPGFRGFPTVVYTDSLGIKHAIFAPHKTMAEIEAWKTDVDNKVEPETPRQTVMTKYTFLKRFTVEELAGSMALKLQGDVAINVAQALLDAAQDIDLNDQNIINYIGYLASKGVLTEARANEILS